MNPEIVTVFPFWNYVRKSGKSMKSEEWGKVSKNHECHSELKRIYSIRKLPLLNRSRRLLLTESLIFKKCIDIHKLALP